MPQEGVGGATPRPRNPNPASSNMAEAKLVVAKTVREPLRLGKMCLNMILALEKPVIFAAKMNSRCLSCRV